MEMTSIIKRGQANAALSTLRFSAVDPLNLSSYVDASAFTMTTRIEKPDNTIVAGTAQTGDINGSGVFQANFGGGNGSMVGQLRYTPTAAEINANGLYRFVFAAPGMYTRTCLVLVTDVDLMDVTSFAAQINVASIFDGIIEGPAQYDGNGEFSTDPNANMKLAQCLREIWARCCGDATGLDGPPGSPTAVLKSRVGGRNRWVGQMNNGNRTATSRDGA